MRQVSCFARLGCWIGGAVLVLAGGASSEPLDLDAYVALDLTHPFDSETLYWPTSPTTFHLERLSYGETNGGYFYASNALSAPEHGGTHLDAPIHFGRDRHTVDQIPLSTLMGPAVVLDVSAQASSNRDYRLTAEDVLDFERRHGTIEAGSIVLLRTGWSAYWSERVEYFGDDTPGDASKLSFPSYGEDAARLLVNERGVSVLGVDTASIDYGRSTDFVVHRIASASNVPGLENLAGLEALPPRGATVMALPMQIAGGSGAPARVIAFIAK